MLRQLYPLLFPLIFTFLPLQLAAQELGVPPDMPLIEISDIRHLVLRSPVEFTSSHSSDFPAADDFVPLTASDINQGISSGTFWLRLRLQNSGASPVSWVLYHESTYLDHLDVYIAGPVENLERHQLSDRQPFHNRPFAYRKLAFTNSTAGQSYTDLYLRLAYEEGKADAMSLNFHLWQADAFHGKQSTENFLFGLFYGSNLSMMLIAFILAFALRNKVYAWYGGLVFSTCLFWLHLNGFGYQYLWPDSVYVHNEGFHISYLVFAMLALQFSRKFLDTARLLPRLDRLMLGILLFSASGVLLRLAGFYLPVLLMAAFSLASIAFLPVVGWLAYRRGMQQASWYTVAWSLYAFTILIGLGSAYTSLFRWGMEPLVLVQIISVVENILLLLATSRRAVSLERERREAVLLANHDPLTGLGNRRLLSRYYAEIQQAHRRTNDNYFFIMIDLDDFKQVNDLYGHNAGDQVLIDFAAMLRSSIRGNDLCIRFGGEEFSVLLAAKNLNECKKFAERLRQRFTDTPSYYQDKRIGHTFSAGITSVSEADGNLLTETEMIRRADAALYAAKANGRNCIICFTGIPQT